MFALFYLYQIFVFSLKVNVILKMLVLVQHAQWCTVILKLQTGID